MITLNDYLFSGDTVLKILHQYSSDLNKSAQETNNPIDLAHSQFLVQITELLEHNDFLTSQSQRIREFYKFMTKEYPFLAFTFKGRIMAIFWNIFTNITRKIINILLKRKFKIICLISGI